MKKWKLMLITVVSFLLLTTAGCYLYVSDYDRAVDIAVSAAMINSTVHLEHNLTILVPATSNKTGLIFYPGGKVESIAYLPLLEQLRQEGITCVLVEMPFHLAVLNPNAADTVFEQLPDIQNWYMAGHSLGGAMASSYASEHVGKIKGLILLGAYIYGDFPPEQSLTLYGSEDKVLKQDKITYAENVIEISGGNHAQFGNYGTQNGDGTATISTEEQQAQTVTAILSFIEGQTLDHST